MVTDLLFYDRSGTGEFYTTEGGRIDLLRTQTGWRSNWTHIVPGQFGGRYTDLLFYDSAGTGEFYKTDGHGGTHLLRTHTGWVSPAGIPWTHIIPGMFGGSRGHTDLLFYDSGGNGSFFATDGKGGLDLLRTHAGWVSPAGIPWTHIIPGHFGVSGGTDLLFYDSAGNGAFYATDGQGGLNLRRTHAGWASAGGNPWTHIIPGQFGRKSYTDLLFYDSAGNGAFYASDGEGGIDLLRAHSDWQSNGIPWTHIIPGQFSGSGFTDLLFADNAGNGAFYTTDGLGGIASLRQYDSWRSSWAFIVPGLYAPVSGVRVHIKVLQTPNVSIATMIAAMRELYVTADMRVVVGSTENIDLSSRPGLLDIDVGDCADGFGDNITGDQWELFRLRRSAGENDVVLYFVRYIVPAANGCAKHPSGRPGAVIASIASQWTVAHEVGHVLGLGHVDDNDRLMTKNGTDNITHPPPDLTESERKKMRDSDYRFNV